MRLVPAGCIGEDVAMGAHRLHAIVLAGGGGRRLGGASKADLDIAGRRLLERVLTGLDGVVDGLRVVVAPPSVRVPRGVLRTLEDPPHGGPLAGIGAGMDALGAVAGSASAADERVLVVSVDTPGVARLARLLVAAMDRAEARREEPAPGWDGTPPRGRAFHAGSGPGPQSAPAQGRRADGALILGGEPRPFRQYLQAVYRCDALRSALEGAGALRGRAVGRTLRGMRLVEVPVRAGLCRDLDTPATSNSGAGGSRPQRTQTPRPTAEAIRRAEPTAVRRVGAQRTPRTRDCRTPSADPVCVPGPACLGPRLGGPAS